MLIEALVVMTCLNRSGVGCGEATGAYYQYNKDLQLLAKDVEAYSDKIMKGHEWLIYVATPLYSAATGRPARVHLYKKWSLNVDTKQQYIAVQWSY